MAVKSNRRESVLIMKPQVVPWMVVLGLFVSLSSGCGSEPEVGHEALMAKCREVPTENLIHQGGDVTEISQYVACQRLIKEGAGGADVRFYLGRTLYLLMHTEKGIEQFRKAHAEGSAKGAVALGYMIEYGELTPKEAGKERLAFYREAAEQNDPVAKMLIAEELRFKINPPAEDVQRAFELVMGASEQGYPVADYYLAQSYHLPVEGETKNMELAVKYYHRAAEGGVADAVEALAQLGEDVSGYEVEQFPVPDTIPRAIVLYRP